MAIKMANPYLMFHGTAEKAVELYKQALGAKVEAFQRFGDVPGTPPDSPAKDRVIHAHLTLDGQSIMVSDDMPESPVAREGNVHVCLNFDDVADMKKRFQALSAGGKVTMELQDTFWGATFGTLVDAYGVQWMFNCEKKQG